MSQLRQRRDRARLRAASLNRSQHASRRPRIAVAPDQDQGLLDAIEEGGGQPSSPEEAEGVIWTDARDPASLAKLLVSSPARWVQLPFAGIERFFDAGVIDPERIWTCAKGIYGAATAEHTLALMLAAARQLHVHGRRHSWSELGPGSLERRLAGGTVVVFGAGGIGRCLIEMLQPLGPSVIAVNRSGDPVPGAERTVPSGELAEVLTEADWVVITAALTPATRGLFDAAMLARMRPTAWLVNVARGGIVVTDALVEALRSGTIAGAALDVTDPEPLPEGHPLWTFDNVLITPHTANTWEMALPELRALVQRNVAHFAIGEDLEGLVDASTGY